MVLLRLTSALLVGCLTTLGLATERGSTFNVSVRVVAPLRATHPAPPPASFVGASGSVALPCGAAGSRACADAATAAASTSGAGTPVVATVLTDGAPTAILDR